MSICSVQLDQPFAKNRLNVQWNGAEDAIGDVPDMWHWTAFWAWAGRPVDRVQEDASDKHWINNGQNAHRRDIRPFDVKPTQPLNVHTHTSQTTVMNALPPCWHTVGLVALLCPSEVWGGVAKPTRINLLQSQQQWWGRGGFQSKWKKKRKVVKVRVDLWWHRPAVVKQSRIFGFKWSSDLCPGISWWWNMQTSTNLLLKRPIKQLRLPNIPSVLTGRRLFWQHQK